jgi:hypothetical protein
MKFLNLLAFLSGFTLSFVFVFNSYALIYPNPGQVCSYNNDTMSSCSTANDYEAAKDDFASYVCDGSISYRHCIWNPLDGSGYVDGYEALDLWGTPSEPSYCSDNQISGDETGIDCGGSCSADCVLICPAGYSSIDGVCVADLKNIADPLGNCPVGYVSVVGGCRLADPTVDGYYMSQDFYDDNFSLNPPDDLPDGFTIGLHISPFKLDEIVIDNGDGTETATQEIFYIDDEGNPRKKILTVTRPLGSPTGTGFASVSGLVLDTDIDTANGYIGTTESEIVETDNEDDVSNFVDENYDYNPSGLGDPDTTEDYGTIDESEYGENPDYETIKNNLDPLLDDTENAIKNSQLLSTNPACMLQIPTMYGRSDLYFDFCKYESYFDTAGSFLVTLVYALGMIFLVERG